MSRVRYNDAYAEVDVYTASPSRADIALDLAGNEGRGPSAEWLAQATEAWARSVRRYPKTAALAAAIAERCGVSTDQVLVSNGGDEAIDRACRLTLCAGRAAVVQDPTFEMIPRYVAGLGAELREVDAAPTGLAERIAAVTDESVHLIAVVSPNNPTGEVTPVETILAIADASPDALVLADLAYVEFADDDPTAALLTRPNVVIIRTLSKAWGLAGLRLGYALGAPEVIARLRAAGGPYAVSTASAAIGAAWLRDGAQATESFIATVRDEVDTLTDTLRARGWKAPDSQANFVTLIATPEDAAAFHAALLDQRVRVRAWPNDPARSHMIRITCPGDADEFAALLAAIENTPAPTAEERT